MITRSPLDMELWRVRIVLGVMLLGFCALGAGLWQIQVAEGHVYEDNLRKQSVRRVRLPGMRGRIFDRGGRRLADNRPHYCLAIYLEELRQPGSWDRTIDKVEDLVATLSQIIGRAPEIDREDIRNHIRRRLPLPLVAWKNLDDQALARWAERGGGLPGVDVYLEAVRVYPEGASACHLLGYVGRADPVQEKGEKYHYYVPEMEGKAGLEKHFDALLRGRAGGRLLRVDVSGYRYGDLGVKEPESGSDLLLAIDADIQSAAERVLADDSGAVVVLDPRNGDVLALASSPGFDPNDFVPRMSSETWQGLIQNPDKPLLNRALVGNYAPGSTFKPVVAMAALENGFSTPEKAFTCPGYFKLGNATFNCWYKPGHGTIVLREALKHSCNVYFYRLGLQCGHEPITHMASALGLGSKTGLEIDYEAAGLVPDDGWKRRVFNDGWREGDTCNLSIGQGALTVTPLQMAVVAATLANKGTVYRPRVVLGVRPPDGDSFALRPAKVANRMHWTPEYIDVVRGGMHDVVMAPDGTGRRARIPGVVIAGKTGTAEYGRKDEGKKYGWMIAFAPFDQPRYAVALVIDEAISGGTTAAPRIAELMSAIFGVDEDGGRG
jgi:penicillin-binding protein 2